MKTPLESAAKERADIIFGYHRGSAEKDRYIDGAVFGAAYQAPITRAETIEEFLKLLIDESFEHDLNGFSKDAEKFRFVKRFIEQQLKKGDV